MPRKPTSHDVALRASVSQATVSYVLSGRKDVSIPETTRARVLTAARELRYRSNNVARSLVRGQSQTLGVIVPQLGLEFHSFLIQGIHQACTDRGYRVLIGYSQHDPGLEVRQVELLLEHQVDGLICIADEGTSGSIQRLIDTIEREDIPCVIIDERTHVDRVDCVISDDFHGAKQATERLIRLGHTRIAHLGAGSRMSTSRDRRAGFLAAMQDAGLDVGENRVVDGSYFQRPGIDAAQQILRGDRPTAVFAASDLLALLVREEALQIGMATPGDLAIIGYGNTELAEPMRLTSVDQHPQQLGCLAADRLFRRQADRSLPPQELVLPTELVIRRSCSSLDQTVSPGSATPPIAATH